jgi:hypothetical protein
VNAGEDALTFLAWSRVWSPLENRDLILAGELRERYLEPWCRVAQARLASDGDTLAELPTAFATDLARFAASV